MSEREKKSPKFYVADGIMLRMRESIAYVLDNPDPEISTAHTARREQALSDRTKHVLETLRNCGLITSAECFEILHKLWDLLDEDATKRQEKANG